jgi:SAM-dependent methyltransferase
MLSDDRQLGLTGGGRAKVLDIGCGGNKTPGAVGVDVRAGPNVDVIWDLDRRPWPFSDDEFETAVCRHALEHLQDVVGAMAEIYRICRPGGLVLIQVPHFSNAYAFGDPTHRHFFSSRSMDPFVQDSGRNYRDRCRLTLVRKRLSFSGPGRYLIEPWANGMLNWFERHLAFILPGQDLTFQLRVDK